MAASSRGLAFLVSLGLALSASSAPAAREAALAEDDACGGSGAEGAACAVNALQTRSLFRHGAREGKLFMENVARRLRTTPDKLDPSLLQVHRNLTILANLDRPANDPAWPAIKAAVKQKVWEFGQSERDWMTFCKNKDYDGFSNKSCSSEGGAVLVGGRVIDAFFCGARKGIDWNASPWNGTPTEDLCHAKVGSAYEPDGACGRHTDKELLLNILLTYPYWYIDARYANSMSWDCIMDILDCDIYYCQKCPGRCDEF